MIMNSAGLSQREFAAKLEISEATLSNVFRGATNLTSNHVTAIHRAFPDVSTDWLMFGEGEMNVASAPTGAEAAPGAATDMPGAEAPEAGALFDSLFAQEPSVEPVLARPTVQNPPRASRETSRKIEQFVPAPKVEIVKRKIREIRVFYDDGTYETFNPIAEKN